MATHRGVPMLGERKGRTRRGEGAAVGAGRALLRGPPQCQQRSEARGSGAARFRVPPRLDCLRVGGSSQGIRLWTSDVGYGQGVT